MSSFGVYQFGFLILGSGVLINASMLSVSQPWLIVIGLVLGGSGITAAATRTRRPHAPTSGL